MADLTCGFIKLSTWRAGEVIRAEFQTKTVVLKAREDVQMGMKYLLTSRFAISQEEIDALAANAARSEGRGNSPSQIENFAAQSRVQIRQTGQMALRQDKRVTGIDRLDVGHDQHIIGFMDEAHRQVAGNKLAEDA